MLDSGVRAFCMTIRRDGDGDWQSLVQDSWDPGDGSPEARLFHSFRAVVETPPALTLGSIVF